MVENKSVIDNLPEKIDNHSCDGSIHIFDFGNKTISCWNISHTSERRFSRYDSEIVEIFCKENAVLKIFKSIYNLLKDYGLKIECWNPFHCEWKI